MVKNDHLRVQLGNVKLERVVGKHEKLESFELESLKFVKKVGKFRCSWQVLVEVENFE